MTPSEIDAIKARLADRYGPPGTFHRGRMQDDIWALIVEVEHLRDYLGDKNEIIEAQAREIERLHIRRENWSWVLEAK